MNRGVWEGSTSDMESTSRPQDHRRTGRGAGRAAAPPSRAKLEKNRASCRATWRTVGYQSSWGDKVSLSVRYVAVWHLQQRFAANVKLWCNVYIGLCSVQSWCHYRVSSNPWPWQQPLSANDTSNWSWCEWSQLSCKNWVMTHIGQRLRAIASAVLAVNDRRPV